jgi:predicted RNA-binding protein with PUA-like domain
MRYWLVRGTPRENGDFSFIRPGNAYPWRTKRPPRDWEIGDRLFFWASSPRLELIALGEFHGETGERTEEEETLYNVSYATSVVQRPLRLAELRADPALKDAIFLKNGPASSVVRLSADEGIHLYRLMVAANKAAENVWPDLEDSTAALADVDQSAVEGDKRLAQHFRRERNRSLVEAKKRAVLAATGCLACEACDFDFKGLYGTLGEGFCEVHHRQPLAAGDEGRTTSLSDLAIVCSNCHRILHRSACAVGVQELRRHLGLKPRSV